MAEHLGVRMSRLQAPYLRGPRSQAEGDNRTQVGCSFPRGPCSWTTPTISRAGTQCAPTPDPRRPGGASTDDPLLGQRVRRRSTRCLANAQTMPQPAPSGTPAADTYLRVQLYKVTTHAVTPCTAATTSTPVVETAATGKDKPKKPKDSGSADGSISSLRRMRRASRSTSSTSRGRIWALILADPACPAAVSISRSAHPRI